MASVQIKRDRAGSSANGRRRPTITTRLEQETMSSSMNTPASPAGFERSPSDSHAPAIEGHGAGGILDGPTLYEEPDTLSLRSSRKGSQGQYTENVPVPVPVTISETAQGPPIRERQRNRSRTIDCILGPPASPGLINRTNRLGSGSGSNTLRGGPIEEDTSKVPQSVDLVLPNSTERELQIRTTSSRKSVSSTPRDGYPPGPTPNRTSREEDRGRPRTGSVGWMKQQFVRSEQPRRDEEEGLARRRSGGSGREDDREEEEEEEEEEERREKQERQEEGVHRDEVVDHLNVIDAHVSAVTYLQDAANTIMLPPIPSLFKSKATITLDTPSPTRRRSTNPNIHSDSNSGPHTITSGAEQGDSTEDLLDTHVKDVLSKKKRSPKKEWFVRSMKGAWAFVKTPIGIITAIYGFLVAFWGAAIVLFLLGWIDVGGGDTKDKWVEISSQVTNGLFTVTGVGFIPWRVRDAYRISAIWRLQHIDRRLRKNKGLPDLMDKNEAPDPETDENFVQVLTDKQQERLKYQQRAFGKSQTWYRPHATDTHRAFSLNWALWICLFTIGNSVFQCFLCGTMWGLNRHERPAWTTGTLIPLSFLCGIASAVLIWKGQDRSKKTAEVEKKLRDALGMEDEGSEEKSIKDVTRQEVV